MSKIIIFIIKKRKRKNRGSVRLNANKPMVHVGKCINKLKVLLYSCNFCFVDNRDYPTTVTVPFFVSYFHIHIMIVTLNTPPSYHSFAYEDPMR